MPQSSSKKYCLTHRSGNIFFLDTTIILRRCNYCLFANVLTILTIATGVLQKLDVPAARQQYFSISILMVKPSRRFTLQLTPLQVLSVRILYSKLSIGQNLVIYIQEALRLA